MLQAMEMARTALPALQRAMPVTIVRDAFFRVVNGTTAGKIRGFLQARRQHSMSKDSRIADVATPNVSTLEQQQGNGGYLSGFGRCLRERLALWRGRAALEAAAEAARADEMQKAKAVAARAAPRYVCAGTIPLQHSP